MVLGQLLGLITAAPAGELSGAGFGPNYTILMKLGFEHYAPRILEEMEKNPTMDFQQTKYFKFFQGHLKNYTDKKRDQTFDMLLKIPQEAFDALVKRFTDSFTGNTTKETLALELGSGLTQVRFPSDDTRRAQEDAQPGDTTAKALEENRKRNEELKKKTPSPPAALTPEEKYPYPKRLTVAQQIDSYNSKMKGKFVKGATSKRRRSRSSDILRDKLYSNMEIWIQSMYKTYNSSNYTTMRAGYVIARQRYLDHIFTYV